MSIEKLPSGNYRARVMIGDVNESKSFPTKEMARRWENKRSAELYTLPRKRNAKTEITLAQALERYKNEALPKCRKPLAFVTGYNAIVKDSIAQIPLAKLSPAHVVALRDRLLQRVATSTARRYFAFLRRSLYFATREWGWLRTNPCDGIKPPSAGIARTRRISDDEIALILAFCDYGAHAKPVTRRQQMAAALVIAVESAMRCDEIVTCRWEDVHIDFEKNIGYVHLPRTKNGDARDVPLSRKAIAVFGHMRGLDPVNVFTVTRHIVSTQMGQVTRRLALENLHFHDSRREACCRLAKRYSTLELARISGHRDIDLLCRVYYQSVPEDVARQIDAADDEGGYE